MNSPAAGIRTDNTQRGEFATTHWSVVLAARGATADARHALAALCETYWYPLYAFVRRSGYAPGEAADLTQGFFAKLLECNTLAAADARRGRFRSFLLTSLKHFFIDEWHSARTEKRGGARRSISLGHGSVDSASAEGRYLQEPYHELTPERLFARRWALTLLERVLVGVRDRYAFEGKAALFERLKPFIGGDGAATSYAAAAADLGSTEGAVKVAVHRLRRRYAESLRATIAETVECPQAVGDEIQDLFAALAR